MQCHDRDLAIRTGKIVACLTKCQNTAELLEEVHEIISDIVYVDNFCVVLLDEDGTVRFPYVVDSENYIDTNSLVNLTIDDIQSSLFFYALTSNVVCNYSHDLIENLRLESLVKLDYKTPEQWISVPLTVDEKSLGALIVQSYTPSQTYTDSDVELLVTIGHVLSNALNIFSSQQQLNYANTSLKAYQYKLESLIDVRTKSLEHKTKTLELEVTQRKLLQKELEQKVLELESVIDKNNLLKERLEHQAGHDFLTGLANRQQLNQHLNRYASKMSRKPFSLYMLFIDLDGFKNVNDTLGHPMGDQVLIAVSQRLIKLMRSHDLIARIGGDEFVIAIEDVEADKVVTEIGERIINELSREFEIDNKKVSIGASVGIAKGSTAKELEELILHADQAMYIAKANGKGRINWYQP